MTVLGRLGADLFGTAAVRVLMTAGRAAAFFLVVRTLTPAEYGTYALLQSAVMVAVLLGTLNMQSYLLRVLPAQTTEERHNTAAALARGLIPFNAVLAMVGAATLLATHVATAPQVLLMAILYTLEILTVVAENYLLGSRELRAANLLVLCRTGAMACFTVVVAWAHGGLLMVLLAWVAADALVVVVYAPRFRWLVTTSGSATGRLSHALQYALPLLGASLAFYLMKSVDRFLLAALVGVPAVAGYDAAYKLVNSFYGLTVLTVNTVLVPRVMSAADGGDVVARDRDIVRATKAQAYSLVACVAISLVMPAAVWVRVTGHQEYANAGTLAAVLAFAMLVNIVGTPAHWSLLTCNRTRVVALADTAGLVVAILSNLVLVPVVGIQGAAWSAVIGFAVGTVTKHVYVRRHAILMVETVFSWADERRLIGLLKRRAVAS